MDDLKRMELHYNKRENDLWSPYHCYPFFLSCKQMYIMTKIFKDMNLETKSILDIGAGEGSFILKLLSLGAMPHNIVAVEFLIERYSILKQKLSNIRSINSDYLNIPSKKYDVITIMAVLTSITDNTIRYKIVEKALDELENGGKLIIYDYFSNKEEFLSSDYRAVSEEKIKKITKNLNIKIYRNVYLKSRYAKYLCKLHLQAFIPILELLKIFNGKYHFMVIEK